MRSILSFLISALIGTTVIVNGVTLNSEDIINETKRVVDVTNLHQIETALEVYYVNKGHYPLVSGGSDMIAELSSSGYIKRIADSVSFDYSYGNQGESYVLAASH